MNDEGERENKRALRRLDKAGRAGLPAVDLANSEHEGLIVGCRLVAWGKATVTRDNRFILARKRSAAIPAAVEWDEEHRLGRVISRGECLPKRSGSPATVSPGVFALALCG